jgi:hypothetical protein
VRVQKYGLYIGHGKFVEKVRLLHACPGSNVNSVSRNFLESCS